MTQIHPTIRTMTWEEAMDFGHYHQGLMMDYGCISYRLSAGTTDNIHIFKNGVALYVLTINTKLDYVDLSVYMANEQDPIDSIFLQGEWSIRECVGNDWRSLSLVSLVSRLIHQFG